jgi:hypothetical protein
MARSLKSLAFTCSRLAVNLGGPVTGGVAAVRELLQEVTTCIRKLACLRHDVLNIFRVLSRGRFSQLVGWRY